jgi:membrane protein
MLCTPQRQGCSPSAFEFTLENEPKRSATTNSGLGTSPTPPRDFPGVLSFVKLKGVFELVKDAATKWVDDSAARLGAALSYYTIFAIPPLFIIVIFVASLFMNEQTVRSGLFGEVGGLVGKQGAQAIQSALHASDPQGKGLLASALAIGALILTATGLFIELQGDLNIIWGVQEKPGRGIWGFVKIRVLSFAMVVAVGFLLLVSLIVSAALSAFGKYFSALVPGLGVLSVALNIIFSFVVITVLFAMVFKVLPDVKMAWRDVWVGAVITALLFTAGKFALGLYLGTNQSVSAYGAAGSVVLILLWVYYSAQILFFGAEVTEAYANRFGIRLKPKPHAEWIQDARCARPKHKPEDAQRAARPRRYASTNRREELIKELRNQVHALKEQTQH